MSQNLNRRSFLSASAVVGLSATALGASPPRPTGRTDRSSSPAPTVCDGREGDGADQGRRRPARRGDRGRGHRRGRPQGPHRRLRRDSPTRMASSSSTPPSCTARPTAAAAWPPLRNIMHPAAVARLVMKRTDHCLLVGEGALGFARAARLPRGRPAHRRGPPDLAPLEGDQPQGRRLDRAARRPSSTRSSAPYLRYPARTGRSTARRSTRTATSAA